MAAEADGVGAFWGREEENKSMCAFILRLLLIYLFRLLVVQKCSSFFNSFAFLSI